MSKLRNLAAKFAANHIGPTLLSSIARSISWTDLRNAEDKCYWEHAQPGVGAFWHDQQLMMPWVFLDFKGDTQKDIYMLISQHRDGRLVASAIEKLGIKTVAGSSTRGGKEALFKLASKIREGNFIAITPDGPKGPRHEVKEGVIRLAQLTGSPIHPTAIYVKDAWQFSSWDKMRLPKPFTKGVRIIGDPIYVPRKIPKSKNYAEIVQQELSELTSIAESIALRQ